jgi:hypothetical protein
MTRPNSSMVTLRAIASSDALRPDAHARTHCRQCGVRVTGEDRYFTLTIPFGPVIGVEHETCPGQEDPS